MALDRVQLLPSALLSAPVFVVPLLWVVVVQLGEWSALGQGLNTLAIRIALVCALQMLMFAFPYLTWRVVCPRVRSTSWMLLLLASVLVGAVVRGIALGILLSAFGVTESPELFFRVFASLSHLAVITVLIWFLVSEVRALRDAQGELLAERRQLIELQTIAQRDLAQLGERTTGKIRRQILDSLGDLRMTDSTELRERLRITIDDVVRPLSHQLASAPSAWTPPRVSADPMGVDWLLAARAGVDPARIHPVVLPILLIWLGLPIHLFQYGPLLTAALVATLAVTIPALWIARLAAIRFTAGRGPGARAVAFVLSIVVGGLALGLGTLPYMQYEPRPFAFVIVAPLLALLIACPLAIAEAARDQDVALEAELRSTTDDLRWTLARTRERYRQQEAALARALHGRLQASLAAAFLRLDRAFARTGDDSALLIALQASVREAVDDLDYRSARPDSIDKVISLTQSTWTGAVELQFACDTRTTEALAADPVCARTVNDLIPELIFNCVKHGSADVIAIKVEMVNDRTVTLTVVDNGHGDLTAARYGLGSTLLDEASVSWSRTRSGDRTATTALLPVAHSDRALVNP